jgi:hypothetical protein
MIERTALSRSERQAMELLPWYVNGTLAGEEHEQVRRELRSSLTCRLEYERLCRVRDLMQQDDAERAATDRAFERLMARIEASGADPRKAAVPIRWLPIAQAAALLALAAGLAWWWGAQEPAPAPNTFETLTVDEPAAAPKLRIVFAAGVPEETRRDLLEAHGLTLTAPPTADGVYELAMPQNSDARAIAEELRADARVFLVTTPPAGEGP